jgi:hypothetical protein
VASLNPAVFHFINQTITRSMKHRLFLTQEITAVPAPNDFDAWCAQRERREMSMASAR